MGWDSAFNVDGTSNTNIKVTRIAMDVFVVGASNTDLVSYVLDFQRKVKRCMARSSKLALVARGLTRQ